MSSASPIAPQSVHAAKETPSSVTLERTEPSNNDKPRGVKRPNDKELKEEAKAKVSGNDLGFTVEELSSNTENIVRENADVTSPEWVQEDRSKPNNGFQTFQTRYFTAASGPMFPGNFSSATASPLQYFQLFFPDDQ